MNAMEVGQRLADLCKAGEFEQAMNELYADNIVSIEGQETDGMPARMEGIEAVRGKSQWWYDNNEIHGTQTVGPFCGWRDDQFIVQFDMDVTPKGGERMMMSECALYTVADGKVVQEEFLYLMGD